MATNNRERLADLLSRATDAEVDHIVNSSGVQFQGNNYAFPKLTKTAPEPVVTQVSARKQNEALPASDPEAEIRGQGVGAVHTTGQAHRQTTQVNSGEQGQTRVTNSTGPRLQEATVPAANLHPAKSASTAGPGSSGPVMPGEPPKAGA